ncbi:hypothetical protein L1987_53492 [Smallanthus sonchifolius]|uniref:Uncharacterized protein n=1 Tax=Smallanthus sonchifolius TaxID=185202 RepID=A0ACB9EVI7_9ASTR|nr:hypothetical protein L1987_53492 [Smallanthus sonchifolius]
MGGWLTIYNTSDPNSKSIPSSARTQLLESIKDLLCKYKTEKVSITCTGHSLGACLAVLSAFDIARNIVTPNINVSAFIFACPQIANQSFKSEMEKLPNLKVLRVNNDPDIFPLWPSKIMKWVNANVWESVSSELLEYVDVGVEILINTKKSPYLKDVSKLNGMLHPSVFHNLEGMLHALSGWNGKDGDFDWGNWWAEKNKGMVVNDHGDWVFSTLDRHDHDLPVWVLVLAHFRVQNIVLRPDLMTFVFIVLLGVPNKDLLVDVLSAGSDAGVSGAGVGWVMLTMDFADGVENCSCDSEQLESVNGEDVKC